MSRIHKIVDIDKLHFRRRNSQSDEYDITTAGYKARILRFDKGQAIELHGHTHGPLHKIILKGKISYNNGKETLTPFQLGKVDEHVEYDGVAEEETFLLLMEPNACEVYQTCKS